MNMQLLQLVGRRLKDDEVMDVLEQFEMVVEYDFDRSHENMPDKYWAYSKSNGLQFCFDDTQTLRTIFVYLASLEGFSPYKDPGADITFFKTPDEVETWAGQAGFAFDRPAPNEFQGIWRESVRVKCDRIRVHYEFRSTGPSMVTLFEPNENTA